VILVPEAAYKDGLTALGCLYEENTGRSAKQPDGTMVFVMTPQMDVSEIQGEFILYLAGWGLATVKDERGMLSWLGRATQVFTEMST
jgi:hypothetical protein